MVSPKLSAATNVVNTRCASASYRWADSAHRGIVLFALGVMVIAIGGRRQVTIREDVHSTGQGRSGFRSGVTPVLS